MDSPLVAAQLQVSADGLRAGADWCGALASRLADDNASASAASPWLASTAAVSAANAQVAAAGTRCMCRVQATAAKLAAAASGYTRQEAESTARFRALAVASPQVC
ncbi:hypothetical protein MSM1_01090 [Mycobacterium sp. SM1]|uniref:hypothetical protein n=1 Tax=Mycobacterium sp. SM1 TaxID=2816243 RepID=UPI001BCDDEA2|nr:hypothetical protein [Mycobacterium sp. SM1]MBS4727023.1 hypothetical protein [Mycobacterium sp. SM1]